MGIGKDVGNLGTRMAYQARMMHVHYAHTGWSRPLRNLKKKFSVDHII